MEKLKVVELFAGVGGFRLGLESTGDYEVVWSNQWEPSTKAQHASWVYEARFGKENHSNEDIATVPTKDIPDHDLLCGGFPCQDYSVATTLRNSKGLRGKKGVLWWSIERILREKKSKAPKYLFLENVDRLLKSPASQRGRDFAIILKSLEELGYAVEWRVINAADYGMPQRRRRVFFLGYRKNSPIYKRLKKADKEDWLMADGIIAQAFPVRSAESSKPLEMDLDQDIVEISESFNVNGKVSPFLNSGVMVEGKVYSRKVVADHDGPKVVLGDILQNGEVPDEFFIDESDLDKWTYLKGPKKEVRKSSRGYEYNYSEGGMIFPDALDSPSRTVITGEGGKSPSRFKHVVRSKRGLRRLTPMELERLNMFPDDHTALDGVSDAKRAFFMGNALVVGVIEKLGKQLIDHTKK